MFTSPLHLFKMLKYQPRHSVHVQMALMAAAVSRQTARWVSEGETTRMSQCHTQLTINRPSNSEQSTHTSLYPSCCFTLQPLHWLTAEAEAAEVLMLAFDCADTTNLPCWFVTIRIKHNQIRSIIHRAETWALILVEASDGTLVQSEINSTSERKHSSRSL